MEYLVGIDLGTSAIKGALLSADGRMLAREKRATELLRPAPCHVEFSSERCYSLVCETIHSLLKAVPAGSRISAISLSGATGNTVLMDKDGTALCNAINWMDARAADEPDCDPPGVGTPQGHRIAGWPLFRGFPLAHLAWLKKNRNDIYQRSAVYAMNVTYLYHRLTNKWGMDHSTATTFYMQDQVKRAWHKPFLEWLSISEDKLPALMPSGAVLGSVTAKAATETGLAEGTSVVLGAFDHPSAARGCGVLRPGDFMLSCGTSWVGFYPVTDRKTALSQNLLVDPFLSPKGPWAAMFSLPQVGEEVQAFVNRTFPDEKTMADKYAKFNAAAAESPVGSSEPCRAIMEKIAAGTKRKMDELERAGLSAKRIVMVGGPSESPVWPGILREMTGLEITIPSSGSYAGALGAAILAGIGSGIFKDEADAFARLDA